MLTDAGCRRMSFCSTHLLFIQLRTPAQAIVLPVYSVRLPTSVKPPWKGCHSHVQKSASDEPPQWPSSHSRAVAPLVPITQVFSAWSVSPPCAFRNMCLRPCCLHAVSARMSRLDKPLPFLPGDEFQGCKLVAVSFLTASLLGSCPSCSSQHASLPF